MTEQTSQRSNDLRWLAPAIALSLVFIITSHTPVDPDMWWHLRAGEAMWQRGQILTRDIFSYTRAGAPWMNVFWLSDLILYGVYKVSGLFGPALFASLMAVVTFGVVYRRMPGHPILRAGFIVLGALAAAPIWTPRPQFFSFLFIAILDAWLHTADHRPRTFILLLAMFALWPNLHGGIIWGFLLLLAHLIGEGLTLLTHPDQAHVTKQALLQRFIFFFTAALIVMLNPTGPGIWKLPFQQVDVSLITIQEWLSPDFHALTVQPILWLLFTFILGLAYTHKKLALADLFPALGFTYLTFVAQRNMGPFALIVAPLAAQVWSDAGKYWTASPLWQALRTRFKSTSEPLPTRITRPVNILLVILIAGAALIKSANDSLPGTVEKHLPIKAITWVQAQRPPGPLFNSYNWGGYILWSLKEYPVFIDGRADLYGNDLINEWWQIASATDKGLAALDARGINLVILEPEYALTKTLPVRGWHIDYSDEFLVILQRTSQP